MADLAGPLKGHQKLTMADQMKAMATSPKHRTSPITGAVENPRREFMQRMIQYRASRPERDELNYDQQHDSNF